jgi:hypothetical protein
MYAWVKEVRMPQNHEGCGPTLPWWGGSAPLDTYEEEVSRKLNMFILNKVSQELSMFILNKVSRELNMFILNKVSQESRSILGIYPLQRIQTRTQGFIGLIDLSLMPQEPMPFHGRAVCLYTYH